VRLRLGSALAGGAAAAVVLFTDYPCPMPAIACLFAVWGGLIMRDADIKTAFIRPTGLVPYVMRSVTFVLPAAFLLWSLAPIKSLKLSNRAGNALATLLPRIEDNTAPAPEPDKVAAGEKNLEAAEADALAAIRANPRNADAWNALACTQLCAAAAVPDPTGKLGHNALFAADKALELDSTNYVFVLTRAAALRAAGRPADAVVALEDAHRLAPWNINTLVSLATALARNPTNSPEQRGRERLLWETANKRYPNNKTIQRGLATATLLGAQQKK